MRKTDYLGGITAFVTTAQLGSFTLAAEQLGLTKSAVAKSVSRLEDRLGLKLLQRSTRRLSLTPDGEKYYEKSQNAIEILQLAEAEITSHITSPSGRLRIDLPAAFGKQRILPLLLKTIQEHPQLSLTVTFSERFIDPIEEGIDLMVRIGELTDSSTLVARRLTTQKLVLCASPEYISNNNCPKNIAELSQHHCIVGFRRNQPKIWLLKNNGHLTRYTPPPTHEFADGDAMLSAVLAGAGISQLPLWLVNKDIAAGKLVEIMKDSAGAEVPINVIWPKTRQLLPKMRCIIDKLISAAEEGHFD